MALLGSDAKTAVVPPKMLLIVATRQGRLAGEPADPSPLEILSVSSDDADEKQEEQDGGVVSASSHSSKQNQNT